jgi:hypothetical protein
MIATVILTWSLWFKSTVACGDGEVLTRLSGSREELGVGTLHQVPA